MTWLGKLLCGHRDRYVERRPLNEGKGPAVMHYVCHGCGHAVPVVDRGEKEHRRVVKAGAVKHAKARRDRSGEKVTSIRR